MSEWEKIRIRGQEFVVCECGQCGVIYVVPLVVHQNHFESGGFAHCSNGHGWGWKEGNADRDAVRRERDRLKQENARLTGKARTAFATAEDQRRQRVEVERKLKAQSARIGAGVCPCCNRTFSQLSRHMQSKHPDVPFVPRAKKRARA